MHVLSTIINQFVSIFGVSGIFFSMAAESACMPFPSEVIMPLGGYFSATGKMEFWHVVIAGIAGNLFGSIIAYIVGRYGGRMFIQKYGKYILLSDHHLKLADKWFSKHGEITVFFGRLLPIVRTFISLPAGIAKMPFYRFALFTVLGCVPWVWLFTWLGYHFGADLGYLKGWLDHSNLVIAALLVIVLLLVWKKGRKRI